MATSTPRDGNPVSLPTPESTPAAATGQGGTGVWRFDRFVLDTQRFELRSDGELQRRTTSPENAVRFLEEFGRIDVREQARKVACPTVVMHSRDDHRVPMAFGEELATLIPDSRLVALSSNNHLLTATEPAWQVFRDELDAFLAT